MKEFRPFKAWCRRVLPAVYDDSLSYYEQLVRIVKKLNELIDNANEVGEELVKVQTLYTELKEYVDHYFDELNIQTEINNKLDAMAEDGTLAEIINEQIFSSLNTRITANAVQISGIRNDVQRNAVAIEETREYVETRVPIANAKVCVLGVPSAQTEEDNGYSDCSVVFNDTCCMIFDLGDQANCTHLIDFLRANGITKIDAVFISHYHYDHVTPQRVIALTSAGFDMSDCVFYLPHGNIQWNRFVGYNYSEVEQNVRNALTNAGITWTNITVDGDTVQVGNCEVTFNNVDSTKYSSYYGYLYDELLDDTGVTNYNNFSMVCSVKCGDKIVCFPGDLEYPAEEQLASVLGNADVLIMPHHGLNCRSHVNVINAVSAKITVVQAYGSLREAAVKTSIRPLTAAAMKCGMVLSNVDGTDVVINMGTDGVYVDTAKHGYIVVPDGGASKMEPGTSFNSYTVSGWYYTQNRAQADTMRDGPAVGTDKIGACEMYVTPRDVNGCFKQIVIPTYPGDAGIYHWMRAYRGNEGWSDWVIFEGRIPNV